MSKQTGKSMYSQQLVTQRKSVACGMYKAEVQN